MVGLVRSIRSRDAGRHGSFKLDARDRVRRHTSQRPDGPSYADHHRRGRHIGNQDSQQDRGSGRLDEVVFCPHPGCLDQRVPPMASVLRPLPAG
ncbi:hypothetical protein VTN02DRAFT_863 [Thermoascus thermophilus]